MPASPWREINSYFARPFGERSVWNLPIPRDAQFEDIPAISAYPVGLSSWLIPDGVSVPVYRATAADPVVRVLYHPDAWAMLASGTWRPVGNSAAIEARILVGSSPAFPFAYHPYVSQSGMRFRLASAYNPITNRPNGSPHVMRAPAGARPSGNADGHMAVFQPDGTVVETYAAIALSDGTIVCGSFQVTDAALNGDGWQNGVTASMVPIYAGLIRLAELEAGSIEHAIKIVAPPGLLHPSYVYPALSFDRGALTEDPPYSGSLPMGARLALPAELDLSTLQLRTDLGRTLAAAAQRYGFIVTDRGGEGITLITEAGIPSSYGWNPDAEYDLRRIFEAVKRITVTTPRYSPMR